VVTFRCFYTRHHDFDEVRRFSTTMSPAGGFAIT